jgi:hypothetical protein
MTHADDVRAPDYLSKTVKVLDSDASVVVCYTTTRDIDEDGNLLPRVDPVLRFDSMQSHERFQDVIRMDHLCEPDFGLTRMDVLKKTRLHGNYADSDRVLLAELSFYGRFWKIPEPLFFRRAHKLQSTAIAPDRQSRTVWFDPSKKGKLIFPHFREFLEYLSVIHRSPILKWLLVNRHRLTGDLRVAAFQTLRPIYRTVVRRKA